VKCDLSKLDDAERRRRELLDEWFQVGTAEILESQDGFAFWLDPACHIAKHVEEFVAIERRVCPFLRFRVTEDPTHDGPVLEIGGADGAKQFVASHFGIRGYAG